jgi:hypothetical protein
VRQAPPLVGWVLQAGRAACFRVLFAPTAPDPALPATILRQAASQAVVASEHMAAGALADDEPVVPLPGTAPTLPLAARPLGLPGSAGPAAAAVTVEGEPEGTLAPVAPGYRLRLALATAVNEHNQAKATELVALGQAQAPGWDADAELARLRRARRWRRAPALVRWLVHERRVR